MVGIELPAAATVVVQPRFLFLSFLRCHADLAGQNDLTDALPVEVNLRSWRIIRATTCLKSLTAISEPNITAADG